MGYFLPFLINLLGFIPLLIPVILYFVIYKNTLILRFAAVIAVIFSFLVWGFTFWSRSMIVGAWEFFSFILPLSTAFGLYLSIKHIDLKAFFVPKSWRTIIIVIFVFSSAFTPIGLISVTINQYTACAKYMENNVNYVENVLPFRLVTEEFAISKANQHRSSFGSNVKVTEAQIVRINDTLYWAIMFSYEGGFLDIARWSRQNNRIVGVVLVDVNDPNSSPIVIKPDDFYYSDGLFYKHKVRTQQYYHDQTNTWKGERVRNYPVWDGSDWVTVSCKTTKDFWGTWYPNGLDILSTSTGEVLQSYSQDEIDQAPSYAVQVYSEWWLEEMVDIWGLYRDTRTTSNVNFFAWFPRASNDRFEISDDTRYIVDPDNTDNIIAVIATNPINTDKSLHGLLVVKPNNFTYFDLRDSGYISLITARKLAEGLIVAPSGGWHESGMPIPYALNTTVGARMAWYVPVYWTDGSIYRLAYFTIIDAKDVNVIATTDATTGISGEEIVKQTRIKYAANFGGDDEDNYQLATIVKKGFYIENGLSIFVFQLNNSQIIRCAKENIPEEQWNDVVLASEGDLIQYLTFRDQENILWAREFILL